MSKSKKFLRALGAPALYSLLATVGFGLMSAPASADTPTYHIVAQQNLPGSNHWDYLNFEASRHHLFIAHADHVDVYDTQKKAIVGNIPNTQGVHGIALLPQLDMGYSSNGKTDDATQFSLANLHVQGNVTTEGKPDAILFDSASGDVFTANGKGRSLSRIDPKTNHNLGNIALDVKPEFTVSDGQGHLYVNGEDSNQIVVVDSIGGKVVARYKLAPQCDAPTGLAIDTTQHRLFSACQNNTLLVINANNGSIMQTLPIDSKNDAVVFDAARHLIFSSNGAGTLTIIGAKDAQHYEVKQVLTTLPGARTMALNPENGTLYLVTANSDNTGLTLLTVSP